MKKCLTILLLLALLATGCRALPGEERFEVLAAFYPLYIMTLQITDGVDVSVSCMASQQTACLHDYQLSTADMRQMSHCDALVINGGMEDFLDRAFAALPELTIVNATEGITLLEEDEVNVHCWLSPVLNAQMVDNIARSLCALDPAHAAQYRGNADRYMTELSALSAEFASLAPARGRKVIAFHESFIYLFNEIGAETVATVENDHGSLISARDLNDTIALISVHDDCTLFAADSTDTVARTIARESGTELHLLDPCTAGMQEKGAYLDAMRRNLTTIKEAFGLD